MASDNVVLNSGSGGATVRTFSDGTNEWPASVCCFVTGGSAGAWTLAQADTNSGAKSAATLRVVIATDQPALTNALTVTANAGTGTFSTSAAQSGTWNIGTVTTLTGITNNVAVVGAAASGAAKSGNPVQAGYVFNTTQPTVTTGQAVEAQATARGGLIVATGVDTFHATIDNATLAVTQSGTWSLAANQSVNVAQLAGTAADTNSGLKSAGTLRVVLATDQPALTNALTVTANAGTGTFATSASQSGTWTVQPGNTANTTPWLVNDRPATSGGLSMTKVVSAASTNATNVKASAGQVYSVQVFNTSGSPRYLKLYNKATAPTVGTDTPVKTLLIPGNTAGAGMVINWDKGLAFGTGIGFGLTTGVGDSDAGAVGANEVAVNVDWQ